MRWSWAAILTLVWLNSRLAAATPNVVFILADDVGYGDLSCYGATKISTPNCDRLAKDGTRFLDAHSPASVCTPTRYSIMTGQYAFRHPPGSRILSGVAPLSIPKDRETVASFLRKQGYATAAVGKWHLGLGTGPTDYNAEISPGPRDIGFEYSFLIPATGDRVPCVYVENHRVVGYDPADPIRVSYGTPVGDEPTGSKNPELLTTKPSHGHNNTIINGISRIGYMSGAKAARWKDEDMADVITAKAVKFIEGNRQRPFFLYFATHDAHVPRRPHPRFQGTSGHGLRGDAIQEFDWSVGEIVNTLDRLKLTDNTLVIVTSDNGGVMDDGYVDGTADDKSGHQCNGLLRGRKGTLYEGGHRVPFLARWPGHVKPGAMSDALICHLDLLAMLAAVTGRPLPAGAGPDSVNMLPALTGNGPGRDHLVHFNGGSGAAIRRGSLKYIPSANAFAPRTSSGLSQLYDLRSDLKEVVNIAKQYPDKCEDLQKQLHREIGAVPNAP